MIKRSAVLILTFVLLVFCPTISLSAQETETTHVYDEAGLLSDEEAAVLEQRCREIETQNRIHILMVTTEDTEGKTQEEYADDFYDSVYPEEKDENGALFLIDMGERELWISTAGIMQYYMSDREIDELLDHMYDEVSQQDYSGAFQGVADDVEAVIARGVSSGDYLINENGKIIRYRSITTVEVVLAAIAGVMVFCLVFFSVRYSYQKKVKSDVRGYGRVSGIRLETNRDTLIGHHVTSRRIPTGPPPGSGGPGGGSSVHTSSSGRSHGGGGRSF